METGSQTQRSQQQIVRLMPSTDGVELALHDFGGDGPPLLIVHATGFHAGCYVPIVQELRDRFRCWGLDVRGHGGSSVAPEWDPDWRAFGNDVSAACEAIAPDGGIVGFGHSMGGAALLMAAHRSADRFDRLVLFEPITRPINELDRLEIAHLPLIRGALRRRRRFDSFEDAYEHYRLKPPLSLMVPEALHEYVRGGFVEVGDDDGRCVELICTPELEAQIFINAGENGVWELLGSITTPTTVIAGHIVNQQPAELAERIAGQLSGGEYVSLPHLTHFGPFTHPTEIAELIAVGQVGRAGRASC
jgi:pimeloyl-ACP methyl ester carboxylesterase